MADFQQAWELLVGNEGSFCNNPKDPGGATRWGVTQRVARSNGYQGDMRDLPIETAREIAKKLYWDPLGCDDYDFHVAFALLDALYNGGHVVLWAQQALGIRADGKIGPATRQALQTCDPFRFVMRFTAARLQYMTMLKIWPEFGKGWARRIAHNLLVGSK
jgi:lysozyme family protein